MAGRWFDERESRDGIREIVINESAARQFFAGESPLGRRLLIAPPHSDRQAATIVGIVRDVRNRGLVPEPGAEIIASVRQIPDRRQSQLYLVVRGRNGTDSLLADIRDVIGGIDPEQPVYAVSTLRRLFADGVAARRTASVLLAVFGVLAIGLASLGIYGVVSRAVCSRTREMGIRAALGARRGVLRRLVVFDAMRPLLAGIVIGLGLLVGGRATLASWLYGVTPEPLPLVLTTVAVILVGLLASGIPAWRASRIEPLEALRRE